MGDESDADGKAGLRARASPRAGLSPAARDERRRCVSLTAAVLALPEITPPNRRRIPLYRHGTADHDLVDVCGRRDVRVLVPVLRDDLDLDWADYEGPDRICPGRARAVDAGPGRSWAWRRSPRPTSSLVPALAVDERGTRLGRGGGSYDRALARVPAGRPVVALLYDGELLPAVPTEPHDRRVTAVISPAHGAAPGG